MEYESLSKKIFSETICSQCESTPMPVTDDMEKEIFWQDAGRP